MLSWLQFMGGWLLTVAALWLIGFLLSIQKHYRTLCRITEPFLTRFRTRCRKIHFERWAMFFLASSLVLVVLLTVFVPYTPPPNASQDVDTGIFEGLRLAYSVFEGDSADFREHISNGSIPAFLRTSLGFFAGALAIIIPISALATAITLLWNALPHHVPIFSQIWYVFSELEANSVRMARSIHQQRQEQQARGEEPDTCVFIFLRTRRNKADEKLLKDLQELNYHLYPLDEARFLHWKQRRKRELRFFFLSENTDENFERMNDFLEVIPQKDLFLPDPHAPADTFRQELYLLSETESAPMLIGHLRDILYEEIPVGEPNTNGIPEAKKEKVKLDVFRSTELVLLDRFRATSYDLLKERPLHGHVVDDKLNILVLGFGKIGREFFRAASHMGVIHNCTTSFTLCDIEIKDKLDRFRSQCPELENSVNFSYKKLDAETDQLEKLVGSTDYHYIVVALGDDERNIRVASRLKRFYRLLHWKRATRQSTCNQPQICVNIEDAIKHAYTEDLWTSKLSWDRSLHVFGGLDQVFTCKVLMPRDLWKAAHWLHRELSRPATPADAPPPAEADHWGEYERRSSIACAAHAACYAAKVGTPYLEKLARWDEVDYQSFIDTEHRRWMAYVRSEGMRKVSKKVVDEYFGPLKNRHADIQGKLTPCLVDTKDELQDLWNHLKGKERFDSTKRPFRQRDELLILNAKAIADGIETGHLPEKAICQRPIPAGQAQHTP